MKTLRRLCFPTLLLLLLTAAASADAEGERPGDSLRELAERAAGSLELDFLLSGLEAGAEPRSVAVPQSDWARVSLTRGRVILLDDAGERPLPDDAVLTTGQIVGTGEVSSTVLAVSSARVTLQPDSALRLDARVESGGVGRTLLELLYGRARAVIETVLDDGEEFSISGPTAVALVRGTDFEVAVPRPGVTTVAVHRGVVEVIPHFDGRPRGEPILLEAGRGIVVGEHDQVLRELSEPPEPRGPETGEELVFAPGSPRRIELAWSAAENVERVRLQLAEDAEFSSLLRDEMLPAVAPVRFELPPGEYHWRLAAEDDVGLLGPFGPARSFSVAVDDVPPELYIEGWELGSGGRAIVVWGRADEAAHLVVGSQPVSLDGDGSFRATLPTELYDGAVPLIVRDEVGNSAEHRLVYHLPRLPLGLAGPGGASGLTSLHFARSLEAWDLRAGLGAELSYPAADSVDPHRRSRAELNLALGLGGWGELAVETPYSALVHGEAQTLAGMGDLRLTAKVGPPSPDDFAYAVYSELELPTAELNDNADLGPETPNDRAVVTSGVALQADLAPFTLLGNLDYLFGDDGGFGYGLGAVWAAADWLSLSTAFNGEPGADFNSDARITPGVHFGLGDLQLNLHGALYLDGRTDLGLDIILFQL